MNMDDMISESDDCFPSAQIQDMDDIFGYPDVSPRVGAEYQAEIPPLLKKSDLWQLTRKSLEFGIKTDASSYFPMGLPIPVTWAPKESRTRVEEVTSLQVAAMNIKEPIEASDYEKSHICSKIEDAECKVESLLAALDGGKDGEGLSNFLEGHCYPFPGSQVELWNDIEQSGFLLGLYVFEKNLAIVKRFVGSKTMGDLLSYYYGKFYGSTDYRRWSDGRKSRSRRCIHGLKIFTGWRQQEIVSRLSCHVSEDCQNLLTEVSRMFEEGKLTLEEYIFTLKDMVGIKVVVEAVAIGQGRRDLTGTGMEPIKVDHSFPVRANIPVGKACSFLTSGEIIKILTGDFRLSKARANDIFYEAVWPRLLARGWQSEQPSDAGSKHSVMYLAPGAEKFSRELVKGKEYFDSVSDVLTKVASEPGILEIEAVQDKEELEGDKLNSQTEQDPEILSKRRHRSYLQPPNVGCNPHSMKFTVVDTSLASEGERVKVRELRNLPLDHIKENTPSHPSSGRNNSANPVESVTETALSADTASCGTKLVEDQLAKDTAHMTLGVENNDDPSTNLCSDRQSRMTRKIKFSRKDKLHQLDNFTPISEQHNLIACSYGELSDGAGNTSAEESHFQSNLADSYTGVIESSKEVSLSSSFAGCSEGSSEKDYSGNGNGASPKKSHPLCMIDLNLPHAPLDSEPEEECVTYEMQNNHNLSADKTTFIYDATTQTDGSNTLNAEASERQQPVTNGRRQSTRNRPTTKALEAIAYGFLDTRRKRKAADSISQDNSMSKSSRRVRLKTTNQLSLNSAVGNAA